MKVFFNFIFIISIIFTGCTFLVEEKNNKPSVFLPANKLEVDSSKSENKKEDLTIIKDTTIIERNLIEAGLVDIKDLDSTISINLKYSTTDNFLGKDIYGDFEKAYLQKDVAEKLLLAQLFIKSRFPYYSLVVFDAARPRSIQHLMWDRIQVANSEKIKYLSNPEFGSLHNYGAAVDLSIINKEGIELDMGTKYDHFGELAYPEKEEQLVQEGKLTREQISNRGLLRNAMEQAGFFNIQTEWWHFNSCYREVAKIKYKIIE